MRRGALLSPALLLASCGILRQIKPDLTLESEQVRLREHHEVFEAAVTALAVDASSRYAALGSYDGALALFDLEAGDLLGSPFRAPGRRAGVTGIEAGSDPGAFEALLSDGRGVGLRVGTTPQVAGEPARPSAGTPRCRIVRGEGVRVRTADRSGESLLPEPRATAAAARGRTLAVAAGASPGTYRLRVFEGDRLACETGLGSMTVSLAFHPNRPEIAVGGSARVETFAYPAGARLWSRTVQGSALVAFDPRGRYLYVLYGESLTILSPESGIELASLSAHRSASLAIAASPEGALLVTGGTRGEIWVWEVLGGEPSPRGSP
ncbi:MAG: WD40 repeat domain-containing protein [Planctomycetota bacterium]